MPLASGMCSSSSWPLASAAVLELERQALLSFEDHLRRLKLENLGMRGLLASRRGSSVGVGRLLSLERLLLLPREREVSDGEALLLLG